MLHKIMKRAHEIAKKLVGDYAARMAIALRQSWKEMKGMLKEIATFEKVGKTITSFVKENQYGVIAIYVKAEGVEAIADAFNYKDKGWVYKITNQNFIQAFGPKKGDIYFLHDSAQLAKETLDKVKKEKKEKQQREIEENFLQLKDTDTIEFICGSGTSISCLGSGSIYFKETLEMINKYDKYGHVAKEILNRKADDVDWGDYSTTETYNITFAEYKKIVAAVEMKKDEKEKALAETKAKKEAELEAKKDEAKRTGEKVEVRRWTEPCCDPGEDCSLDIVVEYIMPNGEYTTKRGHTW